MKKILIVDDEKDLRDLMKEMLELYLDLKIDIAENGVIALEKNRENKYDLIISDFNMPVMNGMKLLSELKKSNFEGKFYLISGALIDLSENKPTRVFSKPFDIKKLESTIKEDIL